MGLFDWFRKRKKSVPLPQFCYDVAYFILPHYVYNDLAKIGQMCMNNPAAAGPFFYVMACQMRKTEPQKEEAAKFRWHHGTLGEDSEYFVLEYPSPPPVDLSETSHEDLTGGLGSFVLAPHFSAIIRASAKRDVSYFILGQAPLGGGTTLRSVLRGGANCNLGPGPEPELPAFLEAVREAAETRARDAVDPVVCDSCGARFSLQELTEEQFGALQDQHYYKRFVEELRMLEKVKRFYQRHPEAEGRIRSHLSDVLESQDPEVIKKVLSETPFDQIDVPAQPLPLLSPMDDEDAEVVDYLKHNDFALGPRIEFVSQQVDRPKGAEARVVPCTRCKVGRLQADPEHWE